MKIYYDVETTGLNYKRHSIIQLGGIIEIDGKVVEEFNFGIQPHPDAIIDDSALKINNITEKELSKLPEYTVVFNNLINVLSKYVDRFDKTQKFWLIGFNNRAFDDDFLRMFFRMNKDKYIGSWFWMNTIDVSVLASQYLYSRRINMPGFSLKDVANELGVQFDEDKLHDALYDAKITKRIYEIVTGIEEELY